MSMKTAHSRVPGGNGVVADASTGFAVIDLETTGLSPAKGARTIEIGLVILDAAGDVEDRWATLVDPGGEPGPTHIHGVTADMIRGAPTFREIAGDLAARLSGRTVVAHNAAFDVAFLDVEFTASGVRWERRPLCTMKIARRRGLYPATLEACCKNYGIVNHGAHHALADADATAELLRHLRVGPDETPAGVGFPAGHPEPSGRIHPRREA